MIARIENWAIVDPINNNYLSPITPMGYFSILGQIFGHPTQRIYTDGDTIHTSKVVEINLSGQHIVATQAGNRFVLGKISNEYVNWCKDNKVYEDLKEFLQLEFNFSHGSQGAD